MQQESPIVPSRQGIAFGVLAATIVAVFACLHAFADLPAAIAVAAAIVLFLVCGLLVWQAGRASRLQQDRFESLQRREADAARRDKALQERDAFLAGLPEPLLTVDANRTIRFMNEAAKDLLGRDLVGRDLTAALRVPDLLEAVEEAFHGNPQSHLWFTLPGEIELFFAAHIATLQTPDTDAKTVTIALYDLTAAKRAESLRADFVANASHELRTPLASLMGFIETLQGPARDDEKARQRFLQVMAEQAARMGRLIDDLLALSRIELHEHTPPRTRVDIAAILQRVTQELAFKAQGKSMELVLEIPADLPPVAGDEDDLMRVYQNLVDNAIKYGFSETPVVLTVTPLTPGSAESRALGRSGLKVTVRNQGEGISRDHIPRLTERFYRVNTAKSRELGGTGLGLAIVKHIVNRHKGVLRIDSELGENTTVTCLFPLYGA